MLDVTHSFYSLMFIEKYVNVFVFLFLLWGVLKVMKRRKSSDEDNSSGSGGDED